MQVIVTIILLVLGEGPTADINSSVGALEKTFCINFTKAKTKFCLSIHYNGDSLFMR